MNYMLTERAARAIRRLLNDANAVVPAPHSAPKKTRPDFAAASQNGDVGAFRIVKRGADSYFTDCVFMFGRCGAPIDAGEKKIEGAGVYTVRINNFTPEAPTWAVYEDVMLSTEFVTYLPIAEIGDDGKVSTDYRRMPFIPAYDRGV